MYITEIKTKTKSGKLSYTCTLLRQSYRENGEVKTKTIANLTGATEQEIEAMRVALKHKGNLSVLGSVKDIDIEQGKSFGAIWVVNQIAKELGIPQALGQGREAKLALWQTIARVIDQGSRLSAVRLATDTLAPDILGLTRGFNEDDLYKNLKYVSKNQESIEKRLFAHRYKDSPPDLFLYDVTSSYFEGVCNELSGFGFNRDKKKGKKQVVLGLLCDQKGDPVSVEVFEGKTRDFDTFGAQVKKATENFGVQRLTFVGDRGMIKGEQIKNLGEYGLNYITAITKAQIGTLIKADVIQMSLFDEDVVEVAHGSVRYILRRNPARAKETENIRRSKEDCLQNLLEKKNAYLSEHPKADTGVAKKEVEKKIATLKIGGWLSVEVNERTLAPKNDDRALSEISRLDGCYCLKTDLPKRAADTETVHARYKDLIKVEEAFRTSKTAHLEMRPWYVVTKESTRGHALVTMLAYLIVRKLKKCWTDFDLTVEEGLKRLSALCAQKVTVKGGASFNRIPKPNAASAKLIEAAGVTVAEALPDLGANVVSRKKLPQRRKKA